MRTEFRIVSRIAEGHDFYEGVRAVLVDKDGKPHWRPASLDDSRPAVDRAAFRPLGDRRARGPRDGVFVEFPPVLGSEKPPTTAFRTGRRKASGLRWGVILTWFMRILSILWIIKGLSAWAVILGTGRRPALQDRLHRLPGDDRLFRRDRPRGGGRALDGQHLGRRHVATCRHEPPDPDRLLPAVCLGKFCHNSLLLVFDRNLPCDFVASCSKANRFMQYLFGERNGIVKGKSIFISFFDLHQSVNTRIHPII